MNDLARAAWSDFLLLANLILKWRTDMIRDMCVDSDVEGCDFVTSETLDVCEMFGCKTLVTDMCL